MDKKDKPNQGEGDQDCTQAFDSDKTEVSGDKADHTVEISGSNSLSPIRLPEISGYKILKILGKGGMGVVYEAEQQNPKRKVALKVMLHGKAMDDLFVRMFEREVETLARLTHPNIGGIYESGRTKDGQYYFAMEIVKGETLDEYLRNSVRKKELTNSDIHNRLHLLKKIVNAVHYAHQRGVIHRDLKPNNIVVVSSSESLSGNTSNIPEIKILDFGLARITDTDVQMTQVSEIGTIKGTLAYMSPEQARGNPNNIDVRSDVYSLGVILYQMLSGKLPKQIPASMLEALRVITEVEAKPLSEVFTGKKRLDSDISTICHKALELNADDRYDGASAMADDIERYLLNQPIQARPPSTIYQLKKMIKRNKLTTAFIGIVFILLVGVSVVMSVLRSETEKARADAVSKAEELQIVTKFQSSMLSDIDAETMGLALFDDLRNQIKESLEKESVSEKEIEKTVQSFDKTLKRANATNVALTLIDEEVLQRAVETIEKEFSDQALIKASLLQTIANTYFQIGLYSQAISLQDNALEIRRRVLGDDHSLSLESISNKGVILEYMGKYEEALVCFQNALDVRRRVLGDDHPETLYSINNMGVLLDYMGRYDEALVYKQEALEGRRRVLGDDHPETLVSINSMGALLQNLGRYDEALPYYQEALKGRRRVLGDDHSATLGSINNIGVLLEDMGKYEAALVYKQEVLDTRRRVLGDDHPETLVSINNMAALLDYMGKHDEALVYYQEALEGYRRILGYNHPETFISIGNMGVLFQNLGRYDEAFSYFQEAFKGFLQIYGDNHIYTLNTMKNLGDLLVDMNQPKEAIDLLLPNLKQAQQVFTGGHVWRLGVFLSALGRSHSALGEFNEADKYLKEASKILFEFQGTQKDPYKKMLNGLVKHYDTWNKAKPNQGYDKEAVDWNRKLIEFQNEIKSL